MHPTPEPPEPEEDVEWVHYRYGREAGLELWAPLHRRDAEAVAGSILRRRVGARPRRTLWQRLRRLPARLLGRLGRFLGLEP